MRNNVRYVRWMAEIFADKDTAVGQYQASFVHILVASGLCFLLLCGFGRDHLLVVLEAARDTRGASKFNCGVE